MTKLEGISQEAWDAGQAVMMESRLFMIATDDFDEHSAIIARAIMAATLAEREACASLCAGNIEVVGSFGRRLDPHEILNEEMHSGLTYAAAIRNRSTKP